eukprot:scaffold275792_cov28-Tisochrysis_lutea.AAC.6
MRGQQSSGLSLTPLSNARVSTPYHPSRPLRLRPAPLQRFTDHFQSVVSYSTPRAQPAARTSASVRLGRHRGAHPELHALRRSGFGAARWVREESGRKGEGWHSLGDGCEERGEGRQDCRVVQTSASCAAPPRASRGAARGERGRERGEGEGPLWETQGGRGRERSGLTATGSPAGRR